EEFVLIDAGMPKSVSTIMKAVEERFGENSRPKAIVLTHEHFDHVGALIELIEHWDVPVYAHPLEIHYITGEKSYPKPDRSEEHTSELQSRFDLVCRLLLEKKKESREAQHSKP